MSYNYYLPEGRLIYTSENLSYLSSLAGLERAMREGRIVESTALMCDEELNIHVDLYGIHGIIPREECLLLGKNEPMKDIAIISRVGKPVCFKILAIENTSGTPRAILSRKAAQIECRNYYLSSLRPGDIIPATVTHLDTFGAFVDIACGMISLLSIDCISVSRISHPADRLYSGMNLSVAVKTNDSETGRIYVTLKELLGTWEENASEFSAGQTVSGIVRSIETYGVFVELAPNLAGLAERREDNHVFRDLSVGSGVSVYIKSIIPERMKIKLVIIDLTPTPQSSIEYFIDTGSVERLDSWRYSPSLCPRIIETVF